MSFSPLKLTPEQLEERRLEGGRLLQAGHLTQAQIARELGVSRATICDWAKQRNAPRVAGSDCAAALGRAAPPN